MAKVEPLLSFTLWCVGKIRKSPRPISSARLHMLPYFYLHPINLVVCKGTYLVTQ